jgi:hypothetical protein
MAQKANLHEKIERNYHISQIEGIKSPVLWSFGRSQACFTGKPILLGSDIQKQTPL